MKYAIAVILILTGGVAAYFLSPWQPDELGFQTTEVRAEDYETAAADISERIDDISPTPPVEENFIVGRVEFAKDTDMAYITYHDTANVFKILVQVTSGERGYLYQLLATFEPLGESFDGGVVWQFLHGRDQAAGRELININLNEPNQ